MRPTPYACCEAPGPAFFHANPILKVAVRDRTIDQLRQRTRAGEVAMIAIANVPSDEGFDYQATAEFFLGKNYRVRSRVLKYMRFAEAADAIRFAIEQLPTDVLLGAYLEVNENRYDSRGIRRLYDRPEYPFPRLDRVA